MTYVRLEYIKRILYFYAFVALYISFRASSFKMSDSELDELLAEWGPTITLNSSDQNTSITMHSATEESFRNMVNIVEDSVKRAGGCRQCGEAATLMCAGCKDLPDYGFDGVLNVRYCSKDCQIMHWNSHKADCKSAKTRRLLARSVSLTKAMFYIHQENSFAWGYFKQIDRIGDYRIVHLHDEKNDATKNMLVPFSTVTDLVPEPSEQEAFLCHLACSGAVAVFAPMLGRMLKGPLP